LVECPQDLGANIALRTGIEPPCGGRLVVGSFADNDCVILTQREVERFDLAAPGPGPLLCGREAIWTVLDVFDPLLSEFNQRDIGRHLPHSFLAWVSRGSNVIGIRAAGSKALCRLSIREVLAHTIQPHG